METLRLIHNLPKTKKTIISKCLGAQKNVALLSEIHPKGQEIRDKMSKSSLIGDPIYQAYKWNNLMTYDEYEIYKDHNKTFETKIDFIIKKTLSTKKFLIIRDWSFIDFFGKPFIEPTYKNLFVKSNLSGDFMVLNRFLVEDLKKDYKPETKAVVFNKYEKLLTKCLKLKIITE